MKKKYVIYILIHGILVLLGAILAQGGDTSRTVGLGLVATGIAGWVVLTYVVFEQRTAERLELLSQVGLDAAFSSRSVTIRAQYDKLLANASYRIDVMGFGLRALLEDYSSSFATWASRAEVRILLLDPEAPAPNASFSDQRDIEEKGNPGDIRRDVVRFAKATKTIRGPRFCVRLYKCLPSINVFRVDSALFFGPYLLGSPSRNQPTFLTREGGHLFEVIHTHFEDAWKNWSREIPHEWLADD